METTFVFNRRYLQNNVLYEGSVYEVKYSQPWQLKRLYETFQSTQFIVNGANKIERPCRVAVFINLTVVCCITSARNGPVYAAIPYRNFSLFKISYRYLTT
jgi:hypothetical protein